ncbi:MAG: hypothetical protein HYY48_10855 [Gammaproteobacteria bacterium]|nr:hypothetical protein [Gammaproteobacteria bacterium]
MKREDLDWPVLTGALVTLLVSIVVSGLLIGGSYYFQKQMLLEFTRNNAQFQAISQRYLAVDEEEKLIRKFYPRFIELYNNGVIGKEQRLNWLEILRDSGEKIRVPGLSYEIKSQEVYAPQFSAQLGRYQLFNSRMALNMQLLHEGDLLSLFSMLDSRAAGTYSVSECRFSRASTAIDLNPRKGNIMTKCDLNWFTIKLADGKDIKV